MAKRTSEGVTLFLCGDLMLAGASTRYSPAPAIRTLRTLCAQRLGLSALAERVNGPIPDPSTCLRVGGCLTANPF